MNVIIMSGVLVVLLYTIVKLITSIFEIDKDLKREYRHMTKIIEANHALIHNEEDSSDPWSLYR